MLKERTPPYQVGSGTHVGKVREENQDSIGYFRTDDGAWLVLTVCDGMGGHAGGKTASTMAVETIGKVFSQDIASAAPDRAIRNAIRGANDAVFARAANEPSLHGMGSTCVLLAVRGEQAYMGHVGDSRIYRIRKSSVERMTRDHSNVQRMVDGGMLSESQAQEHPDSNVLYRCLGVKPEVEPDVRGPEKVEKGDRFLLCSDGLHSLVDDQIIAALAAMVSPQEAVEKLLSLAVDRGGTDNISVQILHRADGVPASGKFSPERFERLPRKPDGGVQTGVPGERRELPSGRGGTRVLWRMLAVFIAGVLAGGGLMWLGLHEPGRGGLSKEVPSQPRQGHRGSAPAEGPAAGEEAAGPEAELMPRSEPTRNLQAGPQKEPVKRVEPASSGQPETMDQDKKAVHAAETPRRPVDSPKNGGTEVLPGKSAPAGASRKAPGGVPSKP